MTTSRNRLHQGKLQAFIEFCTLEGWVGQPLKSEFEVLRMRHPDFKAPLIVYKRLNAKEHLTTHGNADLMVDLFLGHEPRLDDSELKPTAEHAAETLPWE